MHFNRTNNGDIENLLEEILFHSDSGSMGISDKTVEILTSEMNEGDRITEEEEERLVSLLMTQRKARTIDEARKEIKSFDMGLGRFLERVRTKANLEIRVFARFMDVDPFVCEKIEKGKLRVTNIEPSILVHLMKNLSVKWGDFLKLLQHSLALQEVGGGRYTTGFARADRKNDDAGALAHAMEDLMLTSASRQGKKLPDLERRFLNALQDEAKRQGLII